MWQRWQLTALWQRCLYECGSDVHITVKVVATDSAVTSLVSCRDRGVRGKGCPPNIFKNYKELVRKSVLCRPPQYWVSIGAPPPPPPSISKLLRGPWAVIAVTLTCTSLSQHCHYHCCHNAVLVFAATALCSFSLSQRCAHRCLIAVGFLLCSVLFSEILWSGGRFFIYFLLGSFDA